MTNLSIPLLRSIANVRPHQVRRQLRGYVGRLQWVARDGIRHFKRRVLWIVAVNFLGLVTAASSLGGIVLYAKHAESGKPIHLWGHTLHLNGNIWMLLFYGAVVAGLGIISGASLYYTEWLIQRTTREYEKFCTQRLLDIISDPIHRGWQTLVDGPARAAMGRLLNIGSRWTAFTFRDMLRSILPVLTFIFAAGVLVYTDVWLTLMLVPVSVLYLIPLYMINRRVAANQVEYRQRSTVVRGAVSRGMRRVLDSGAPPSAKLRWREQVLNDPEYERMMAAYYARMIADKRVQFLNTSFFVTCLFALFVFFGVVTRMFDRSWAEMLTYLFAMRYAVNSLRQVTAIFIKFSKFLPEYRAYSQFVESAQRLGRKRVKKSAERKSLPELLRLPLNGELRWDSAREISFRRGETLWVLTAARVSQFELEAVAARLGASMNPSIDLAFRAAFYSEPAMNPDASLRESALGHSPQPDEFQRVRDALQKLCVLDEIEKLPQGWETTAAQAEEIGLSDEATFAVGAGHMLIQETDAALLAGEPLARLRPDFVARLLTLHQTEFTIFLDHRPETILDDRLKGVTTQVAGVIVMEGKQIIAGGDTEWLKANSRRIKRFLQSRVAATMADEDDLDDDDSDSME